MADEPDLMGIGQHCAREDCQLIEFLPFHCTGCRRVFCLEHRAPGAHGCVAPPGTDETIVCPLCAKGVRLQPGADADAVFEAHTRTDCDPSNYARVHNRPRCPAPGCKERLGAVNAYTCKACGVRVCMRHRHGDDHACGRARAGHPLPAGTRQPAPAAAVAAAAAVGRQLASRANTLLADLRHASSSSAAAAAAAASSAAARGPRSPPLQQQQQEPGALHSTPLPAGADDANSVRGTADRRRQQLVGIERFGCPRCGAVFTDAVLLVDHSRQCGGGAAAAPAQSSCVLC